MAATSPSTWDVFVGGTAALVASAALLKAAWTIGQRTAGRRFVLARKLASLRIGMAQRYVERSFDVPMFEVIDKPSWQGTADATAVWDLRSAYLACHFKRGELLAFTVVTTDRWFQPALRGFTRHALKGRLGRITFEAASHHPPSEVQARNGAAMCDYAEKHYIGRPGGYNDFILASTSEGRPSPSAFPFTADWAGGFEQASPSLTALRRSAVVNCVTVAASLGSGTEIHDTLLGEIGKARLQRAN